MDPLYWLAGSFTAGVLARAATCTVAAVKAGTAVGGSSAARHPWKFVGKIRFINRPLTLRTIKPSDTMGMFGADAGLIRTHDTHYLRSKDDAEQRLMLTTEAKPEVADTPPRSWGDIWRDVRAAGYKMACFRAGINPDPPAPVARTESVLLDGDQMRIDKGVVTVALNSVGVAVRNGIVHHLITNGCPLTPQAAKIIAKSVFPAKFFDPVLVPDSDRADRWQMVVRRAADRGWRTCDIYEHALRAGYLTAAGRHDDALRNTPYITTELREAGIAYPSGAVGLAIDCLDRCQLTPDARTHVRTDYALTPTVLWVVARELYPSIHIDREYDTDTHREWACLLDQTKGNGVTRLSELIAVVAETMEEVVADDKRFMETLGIRTNGRYFSHVGMLRGAINRYTTHGRYGALKADLAKKTAARRIAEEETKTAAATEKKNSPWANAGWAAIIVAQIVGFSYIVASSF